MRRLALITLAAGVFAWGSAPPAAGATLVDPILKGPKTLDSPISLYQGRAYQASANSIRLCIRDRESNHDYRAVSRGGTYRGAYQMSAALGVGAGWMIQKELRQTGTPKKEAARIGKALRNHPVNQWHPYYQQMAFWLVWDEGNGKHHWRHTGPGTGCY